MMTQSVMTQAAGMLAGTSGSVTLKGKQTGNDFGLLFGNSLKSARNSSDDTGTAIIKKTSAVPANSGNNNKSDNAISDDTQNNAVQKGKSAQKSNAAGTDAAKASDQKPTITQTDHLEETQNGAEVSDQTQEPVVDEQLIAQIEAMLQAIGQAVMDQLKLSPEELNQLLNDQGMSLTDLLLPENLQQLVIAGSGAADILEVLTNENLADTMKQLLQTVQNIVKDSNTGLTADQIKALIEQARLQSASQNITEPAVNETGATKQEEASQKATTTQSAENLVNTANQNKDKSPDNTSDAITQTTKTADEAVTTNTAETDTASHSDSNSRSDKEFATDRFQTFLDNLVKASQNLESQLNGELTQTKGLREIANQIIERIKVSVSANQTSMELQLNPESLGKVNLSVQSKDGILTAHFVVQNEISKEAIESQMQSLRDTLHQQGIKVEAIEVTVSANAFDQNSSQGSENGEQAKESNSGNKISLEDALNMTDVNEDVDNQEALTGLSGNVINYTA